MELRSLQPQPEEVRKGVTPEQAEDPSYKNVLTVAPVLSQPGEG